MLFLYLASFLARFLSSKLIFNIQALFFTSVIKGPNWEKQKESFQTSLTSKHRNSTFPQTKSTHAKDDAEAAQRRTPFRPCPEKSPSMSGKESVLQRNLLRGYIHSTYYQTIIYIREEYLCTNLFRALAYQTFIDRMTQPQACHTMKMLHISK